MRRALWTESLRKLKAGAVLKLPRSPARVFSDNESACVSVDHRIIQARDSFRRTIGTDNCCCGRNFRNGKTPWFRTERSEVQFLSPRPPSKKRTASAVRFSCRDARALGIILKGSSLALFLCAGVQHVAKSTSRPVRHRQCRLENRSDETTSAGCRPGSIFRRASAQCRQARDTRAAIPRTYK